ncbi:hypothetical phage protein [Campylobacter phage CPt10]|uniref:Uncharacterized protein n=2 Tax=Firehammervirus CPt10 TaxID=722418 RepID=A0A410T7L7_9CAUD|nr:hypothetical protein APL46_gp153 [Campylobacter phage CPt10]QAU04917.1 hypothetical protein [Campylobacter phage CP20]CBJ94379.1 hypothetical phage protein [Campylobacter phage CPt10]
MVSTDNSKATSIETNQYIKNPKYTTKEAIDKFVNLLILGRYTEKDLSDALNYCLIRSTESFDNIDSIKEAIEELKKDSEAFKIFIDNTNKLLDAIQGINKEQTAEIDKINEFLKTVVTLDTEQTITGTKTFNKIYVSDPTENKQAANAQYVMDYVRNQLNLTIGDLSNLKTESKDLIVNAINEVLDNLNIYKETINETTINQMIDTKLNPLIGRITTIESTVDYTKELAEANKQAIDDLNTKVVDNTSDITDINRRLEEAVFYSKINDTRKTIQLKNYDSISGVSTTGEGINIAMVSKWDKVDLGSNQIPINLNGSETRPTYNDSKEIALIDDVNLKADSDAVYNKSEIDTKLETKANSSSVYNKEDSDARFVSLTEDQSIEGNKIIEGIWEYNGVLSKPKQLATTEYVMNYAETHTNQKVGDLTGLKTEAKDTAVAAINELFDKIGSGSADNVAYNISNIPLVPYNDVSSLNTKNICVKISATTDSSNYSSGDTVVVSNFKIKLKGDDEYLKPYGVEVIDRENNKIGLNLIGDDTVYNDNDALLSTRPSDFNSSSVDLSSGSNALVTVKTNGAYDYSGVYDIPNPFREYNKKYSLFLSNDGLKNPYYQVGINSSKQVDNISFQLFGTSATNPFLYSKDCKIELFIENTIVKTFNIKGSSGNNSPVNINIDYKDGMFLISVLDSINYINNRINKNAELLTGLGKPNFSLNPNKIGSLYSDTTNKAVYMCIDNTFGANKWVNIVTGDEIKPSLRKIEITCNVKLRSGQYGGCMSGVKIGFDNGYASTKQIVKGLNSGQILLSLDGLGNLSGYSEVSSLTPSGQDIKVDVDTTGIYNDPSYHCVTNIFKEYLGNADQCSLWSDASVKQLKITLLSEKIPTKILYVGNGYYGQTSVSDVKAVWYYVNDSGDKIEGNVDNDLKVSDNVSETNDSSYIYAFNIN